MSEDSEAEKRPLGRSTPIQLGFVVGVATLIFGGLLTAGSKLWSLQAAFDTQSSTLSETRSELRAHMAISVTRRDFDALSSEVKGIKDRLNDFATAGDVQMIMNSKNAELEAKLSRSQLEQMIEIEKLIREGAK